MEFPSKCPYCGKDTVKNLTKSLSEVVKYTPHFPGDVPRNQQNGLTLELHRCIHCKNPIFLVKEETVSGNVVSSSKKIFCYPTIGTINLPKRVKELSPTAYKTYEQTIKVKEQGFDMLVGAGLRIALEWLVWDYLIKIKGKTESELENLKLYERINLMSDNFYKEVCTRLIRLFGNDSVHIVKQINFSVEEVIECFEMLCGLIDSELKINEINGKLPPKKS